MKEANSTHLLKTSSRETRPQYLIPAVIPWEQSYTFCMGDKRIVTQRSDLMFHDYSGGARGKAGEIEAQVKHTAKHLRKFFKDIIVEGGFLTNKEFKQMLIGKDFWFDHKELLKRGIATHILIDGKEITAKKYLKNLEKKKNNKDKVEI